MKSLKNDFSLMSSLLIPVAVAINFTGSFIASSLKLPLFLDAIGTVFISLIAGSWVGSVTAVITSIATGGFNPVNLAFLPVGILIAVVIGNLTKLKIKNIVVKIILLILALTITIVIANTVITLLVYKGITPDGTGFVASTLIKLGFGEVFSVIAATFVSEIMDKSLTIIIAVLIAKSMSDRYLIKFKYGENYIK